MTDTSPSLADQIGQMLAESKAHSKAKRKAGRQAAGKRSKANPYKEIVTKEVEGGFEIEEIDHRLADPYWSDVSRIILVREVECQQCGLIQTAPNEFMLKRMEHPIHGRIDEAITLGDSKYDNLPVKIEVHRSPIHMCQHCITEAQAAGGDTAAASQTSFDFDIQGTDTGRHYGSGAHIEEVERPLHTIPEDEQPSEELDIDSLFEDSANQDALEGM